MLFPKFFPTGEGGGNVPTPNMSVAISLTLQAAKEILHLAKAR
jgi:hypothetical protein